MRQNGYRGSLMRDPAKREGSNRLRSEHPAVKNRVNCASSKTVFSNFAKPGRNPDSNICFSEEYSDMRMAATIKATFAFLNLIQNHINSPTLMAQTLDLASRIFGFWIPIGQPWSSMSLPIKFSGQYRCLRGILIAYFIFYSQYFEQRKHYQGLTSFMKRSQSTI